MVSRDGGMTFMPSNQGYSGRRAYFILPDREQAGRIYASTINTATGGGFFFVSNDDGETWQPSMRNMPDRLITYAMLQDRNNASIIYLGTNLGVYRSTDRGASWSSVGAPSVDAPAAKPTRRRSPVASRRGARANAARRNATNADTTQPTAPPVRSNDSSASAQTKEA